MRQGSAGGNWTPFDLLPTARAWGAPESQSLPLRGGGGLLAERLKKPLSRRIILAIERRQCVPDGFGGVFPADRLEKPLSHRIIPAVEGRQCVLERIDRPGIRLVRRLDALRYRRLRQAFIPGAGNPTLREPPPPSQRTAAIDGLALSAGPGGRGSAL